MLGPFLMPRTVATAFRFGPRQSRLPDVVEPFLVEPFLVEPFVVKPFVVKPFNVKPFNVE